jgi:hypothetical protein
MQKKAFSWESPSSPSHKAAAVTHTDTSDMSYHNVAPVPQPSTLSPAEIEALIHQVLSKSTLNTTGRTKLWYSQLHKPLVRIAFAQVPRSNHKEPRIV